MYKKVKVSVHITPASVAVLNRIAEDTGLGRSMVIEMILRGTRLEDIAASAEAAPDDDNSDGGQGEDR